MKNVVYIGVVVLIVIGVLFILKTGGDQTKSLSASSQNSSSQTNQRGNQNMPAKTYSSFPGILAENERIGKKATIETNVGNFTVSLFGDKAPKAVSNFIFLVKNNFYNGLIFHRVIANFMIQGGDPAGNGSGGPGYQFADEFDQSLNFSQPGMLAMANSGPNTNGSQFFITVAPTTWLNGKHTVFGQVVSGMEIVNAISKVKTDSSDRPESAIVINKIDIQ